MKKYKIAIGGLNHESNTLNPIITKKEDFFILKGENFFKSDKTKNSSWSGISEKLKSYNYEVIPTIFARAVPNGVVSKDFYLYFKNEMVDMLLKNKNIDAITLALHGSMYVEDIGDAEGDLLEEIRHHFPNIPIFVALDMHTTWTSKMAKYANGYVAYKTAPHIDTYETGEEAARLTKLELEGNNLTMASYKIPILIAGEKSETTVEPMTHIIEKLKSEKQNEDIVSTSFLLGFPWADNKNVGVTSIVITRNNTHLANEKALELAQYFWNKRSEFKFHVPTYENNEAIDKLLTSKAFPSFLSDSGDNPTAGSTGDSTDLLKFLLKRDEVKNGDYNILYSGFFDPISLEKVKNINIGESTHIELGGHFDKVNGNPIKLNVILLKYVKSYGNYNSELALVKHNNLEIVLTSKHIGFGDELLLKALDIDIEKKTFIIVKLGYLEDCFRRISKYSIMASSKGCSNEILETINYKNIPRPFYPIDKNMTLEF